MSTHQPRGHKRKGTALLILGAGCLAACSSGPSDAHAAAPPTPRVSTGTQQMNSQGIPDYVVAQGRHLQPLRNIAAALAEQGRSRTYAGTYVNVKINSAQNTVTILLTNTSLAPRLIRAARISHPGINTALVRVKFGHYSQQSLDKAINKILASPEMAKISLTTIAPAPDGSRIEVTTSAPSAKPGSPSAKRTLSLDTAMLSQMTGFPVSVQYQGPITAA